MKALTIILLCTWKFAATFPVAVYVMKMSYLQTILYTNIGGILGALIFVYISAMLIKLWKNYVPPSIRFSKKERKIFTRRNRKLVKMKATFGFFGIIILSPVILSIPVGSFLIVKYYGSRITNVLWLIAGQVAWSLVYTIFYTQIRQLFA
jgi:hypothetical protein